MNSQWIVFIEFAFLSLFLGSATYLKRTFPVFRKYLIPDAIIAGFIGLILGPDILNLINLTPERLGDIIYHLMAIGFIALTLKDLDKTKNRDVVNTGFYIVSTYLVQGIVGFALSLVLAFTIFPGLFPAFGLLLPLGYGQGPGQAYSIGSQWEAQGFLFGGNIGLTIATLGFLWASIGGILLLNYLVKVKKLPIAKITEPNNPSILAPVAATSEVSLTPVGDSSSVDKITIQLFLIGIVYLVTYGTLTLLSNILVPLGGFGETLASMLWGFHFIIGSLYALLLRIIFDFSKKRGYMVKSYPDNYLLERISGGCFDFMIAAAISAISISIVREFMVPIFLISIVGGLATMAYITYFTKKIYSDHILEYTLALYGMLTGTISTGLALLREVDPYFKSQVAEKLVLGSGIGLILGFPLMIILNIPVFGYINNQPIMYLYTVITLVIYLGFLLWWMLRSKSKGKES